MTILKENQKAEWTKLKLEQDKLVKSYNSSKNKKNKKAIYSEIVIYEQKFLEIERDWENYKLKNGIN